MHQEFRITVRRGSGPAASRWLWYLDQAEEQLAHGDEETLPEAVSAVLSFVELRYVPAIVVDIADGRQGWQEVYHRKPAPRP